MRHDLVQGLFCKIRKEVFRIFWREKGNKGKGEKTREVR